MKTISALALALILCAAFTTAASACGWHNNGNNYGYHNGRAMHAEGYGGQHRGQGFHWNRWNGDDNRRQYERRDTYQGNGQRGERDFSRDGYRDERR